MKIIDLVPSLPVHPTKKIKTRSLKQVTKIIIHTTDGDMTPSQLAKYDIGPNHIDKTGCPSVTYHYYIDKAGEVSRTAPWQWITWHAGGYNTESVAVVLNYKTDPAFESGKAKEVDTKFLPTGFQMVSLVETLLQLCQELKVSPTEVKGHRELFGTGFILVKGHKALRKTCPGRGIDLDQLRRELYFKLQIVMKEEGFYAGKLDGDWGPASKKAWAAFIQ
jgi:N-acetyl-anhydromuramyl-L-alanine amidase AmpD